MKYILILILIILIVYIGSGLSRYYIDRQRFFADFKAFLEYLLLNINFEKNNINSVLIKQKLRTKNKYLYELLEDYSLILRNKKTNFDCKLQILNDDEKNVIFNLLGQIGKTDFDTEKMHLQASIERINNMSIVINEEYKKYGGLYTKLSLLLGLALAILLI